MASREEGMLGEAGAPSTEAAIGIDMGTASFRVAVWKGGKVEVVSDGQGRSSVPAVVTIGDGGSSVGNAAGDDLWSGATVSNIKRLIGRMDVDPVVLSAVESSPFLIHSLGIGVKPFLGALCKNVWRSTTPEEVLSLQLMEARAMAEAYLGRMVSAAVITVPVSFSRFQLTRVERAATMAGFQSVRLMPEPTAVALYHAYAQAVQGGTERLTMVFSMGAGYCDVGITATEGGVVQVRGSAGEALGGEDLRENLVRYMLPEMLKDMRDEEQHKDEQQLKLAAGRLRASAGKAMEELSSCDEAEVEVVVKPGKLFKRTLTRGVFEEVNGAVFERCRALVRSCLKDADVRPEAVSEVVITGGVGAAVPAVETAVREAFNGCVNTSWRRVWGEQQEAVKGATLEGAVMSGTPELELLTIQAVPLSIGIGLAGGEFLPLLKRNSVIPGRRDAAVTTVHDSQKEVLISVYEGESELVRENQLLGFFKLSGIPAAPRGVPVINVCADVDASNMLRVIAGAYVASYQLPSHEVRMPNVDDGHGWCIEALFKQHGNNMDVTSVLHG